MPRPAPVRTPVRRARRRPDEPLRVLQSVPEPRPTTNPYVIQLIDSLREAGVTVLPFHWRTALFGRYDVFHVHWPENLPRAGSRPKHLARTLATLALLVRLRVTGTPLVRTLHNVGRHESQGRVEDLLLGLVDRWTGYAIAINPLTPAPPGVPVRTIRHGHYRDWYGRFPRRQPVPGRLAYVGLIRPYKGVEQLITAFRELPGEGLSLTVSGQPRTPELADELRRLAAGDDRITLDLSYVSDEELAARVGQAELVVLPYRQMHNSGVALAALSLDRPVLVPATPVNAELSAEVGPGWVIDFEGEPTADVLSAGIQALDLRQRSPAPDLSERDWTGAGEQHRAVYAEAVRLAEERRRRRRRPGGDGLSPG